MFAYYFPSRSGHLPAVRATTVTHSTSRIQERALPPPSQLYPLGIRLPSSPSELCVLPNCTKAARVTCGRCLDTSYCCEGHRSRDWRAHLTTDECNHTLSDRAAELGFSVNGMKVVLRPRRGSPPGTNAYLSYPFNSAARFYCQPCKRTWVSAKASASFDLVSLRIVKIYSERCSQCEHDCTPTFFDIEKSLISLMVWLRDLEPRAASERRETKPDADPHIAELCELCAYGMYPHSH